VLSTRTLSLRKDLLTRLLETYERSVCYLRHGPWPREVIIKLDARAFPEAFSADGREQRTSLMFAVRELESLGCARLVCHARGPLASEPKEIRLGPAQLEKAFDEAKRLGFEPLAMGLAEIDQLATRLVGESAPSWMKVFLQELADGARKANLSTLGMSRERFKREWRDLASALTAATFLAKGIMPAWERVVSERLFKDSKLLSKIRSQVISVLVHADPRWEGIPPEEAADLLESYGVRRKPGLIRCAGAATLHVGSRVYRLEDFWPVAHLPDSWAVAWAEGVIGSHARVVTTVENEFPFLSYVEECGGPAALGTRGELVVYTAGFPTPTLMNALNLVAEQDANISFRHWGDADVGGLRIWWFLRERLGRQVDLFRTTADWVAAESGRGGRRLSGAECTALVHLRTGLESLDAPDATAARQLIESILKHDVKIEQERY
jgi:hypothetical protein